MLSIPPALHAPFKETYGIKQFQTACAEQIRNGCPLTSTSVGGQVLLCYSSGT